MTFGPCGAFGCHKDVPGSTAELCSAHMVSALGGEHVEGVAIGKRGLWIRGHNGSCCFVVFIEQRMYDMLKGATDGAEADTKRNS